MEPITGSSSPPSDLFIVLEPFRAGFADFVRALEPLNGTASDGTLLGSADVYYRADTDIALLTIRLDKGGITPQKLAWLTSVAARADLPVLDPSRLGFSDRRAFYEDYLPNYRVRVEARGGPQEALEELARLLALPDAPPLRPASSPSARPAPPVSSEDSSRRTVETAPRAPSGTEPNGRYGSARTVGESIGARSASRRTSGTQASGRTPQATGGPQQPTGAPPARDSSGTGRDGRQKTLEYQSMRRQGRRRPEPALTTPEGQRVREPDESTGARPAAQVTPRGAAVYPLARELSGPVTPPPATPTSVGAPSAAASKVIVPMPASPRSTGMAIVMPPTDSDMPPGGVTPTGTSVSSPSASVPPPPSSRDTGPGAALRRDTGSGAALPRRDTGSGAALPRRDTDSGAPGRRDTGPGTASREIVTAPSVARDRSSAASPAGTMAPEGSIPPPTDGVPRKRQALIVEDDEAPPLQVRFLRGDTWAPGRLRALSLQGARLAAAAPPRLGDLVQLALGLDHMDVHVSGEVTQVTGAAQAAGSGEPSGFAVHFRPFETGVRGKLVNLLKRAKQSGISLRPPPPRASVRFPVRWPTGVITSWGELSTASLDVSRSGLFIAAGTVIGAREIIFHLPMDTSGRALSGRAEVAREVTEEMATQRGLTRGYGVRIVDFTRNDGERYDSFLERIRQRTEKRVMIAARRERATDLGRGLMAAGYAVHSGNDLVALAESMNEAGPPPDAALIDATLLTSDANAAALKRALHTKQVPCLTLNNEQPERARAVVDHLLQIT
jgi:hypothetical protein